jgi:hypothetical protein
MSQLIRRATSESYGLTTVGEKLGESVSILEKGAVIDGVTDDIGPVGAAIAASPEGVFYPSGTTYLSAKPSGFNSHRRRGLGVVKLGTDGDVFPDDDAWRYDPNGNNVTDYSVRLTRNRADITTDPAKRGYYVYQNYTSSRAAGQLFGFAANIKRNGGNAKVVPAQLNGYALDAGTATVWGVATQAVTGDETTDPAGSSALVGGEFAVVSQYHNNSANLHGAHLVFKNRFDSQPEVLHGAIGSNAYNRNAVALKIDAQSRPAGSGAFTGWCKGIYFTSNGLDESVDGKALGIDFTDVNVSRVDAAIKLKTDLNFIVGSRSSTVHDGFVFRNDGSGNRIEFVRDITGVSPVVKSWIDLTLNGPSGTIMAYASTSTTVGAAGGASALPATPSGYVQMRIAGTNFKIPYYAV